MCTAAAVQHPPAKYVGIKQCPVFFLNNAEPDLLCKRNLIVSFFFPRIQWDTNSGASHKSVHNVTRDVVGRMWFWMPCRSSMIYLIPWRGVPWVFNATAPWWYLGVLAGLGGLILGGRFCEQKSGVSQKGSETPQRQWNTATNSLFLYTSTRRFQCATLVPWVHLLPPCWRK